jgi:hypothetical protein
VREAVGSELIDIISAVDSGSGWPEAKARALYLMGELGFVQYKEMIEEQTTWRWRATNFSVPPDRDLLLMGSSASPAEFALSRLRGSDRVIISPIRDKATLANYPKLLGAINALRNSNDRTTARKATSDILEWYGTVCNGMESVLDPSRTEVYSIDVKCTAAHLLGEYRSWRNHVLLQNIDLKDLHGVSARLPAALRVTVADARYPCAVALVKIGRRVNLAGALNSIEVKPALDQEGRERIAGTLLLIDAQGLKSLYEKRVSELEKMVQTGVNETARQQKLDSLKSVKHIISPQ